MPVTFGTLKQRSPEYDRDLWLELDDLYKGGYEIARRMGSYLPRLLMESPRSHAERVSCAAYISYFGQIVDYFTASLFAQELTVAQAADAKDATTPGGTGDKSYYSALAHDADLQGNSFATVLRGAFTTALVKRRALLAVDLPSPKMRAEVQTRADEDTLGANRAYVYETPVEQLIDWAKDDRGNYLWAILHRDTIERASPFASRNEVRHQFKVWAVNESGFAEWRLYELRRPVNLEPKDTDEVPEVDGGVTSFRQIPLIDIEMPFGLWVGNKIGPLAREHLQRRSALVSAENRNLTAIPVVKLGSELGAPGGVLPAEAQQNPGRSDIRSQYERQGFVVLGSDDALEFAEPGGKAYEIIDKQIGDLKDEMFRVVHQMAASVDNSSTSLRRSGDSKKQDRAAEAIVLGAMGAIVRQAAKKAYDCISAARSERVVWTPHGLDNFDGTDRAALIDEATKIPLIDIPSKTFKQTYRTQVALGLVPNIPPETQEVIRDEIEEATEAEQEMRDLIDAAGLEPDGDETTAGEDPGGVAAQGGSAPKTAKKDAATKRKRGGAAQAGA